MYIKNNFFFFNAFFLLIIIIKLLLLQILFIKNFIKNKIMKYKFLKILFSLIFLFFAFFSVKSQQLEILSGFEGGSYYQFASDISSVTTVSIKVEPTNGSMANFRNLSKRNNHYIVFCQFDVMQAKQFEDEMSKRSRKITASMRTLLVFGNEEIHLVAKNNGKINKIKDLKRKKVAIGTKHQGTYFTANKVKELTGVKWKDITISFDDALSALLNGEIDAFFFVGNAPVSKLKKLSGFFKSKIKLLPIEEESLAQFYSPVTIPAGTYKWANYDVDTYATKTVLAVNTLGKTSQENDKIKKVLEDIKENIEELRTQGHPRWNQIDFTFDGAEWEIYEGAKEVFGIK